MSERVFPCPYCKGRGGEKEVICDDGTGPFYPCGGCGGEGMVVVGSEQHLTMQRSSLCERVMETCDPRSEFVLTDGASGLLPEGRDMEAALKALDEAIAAIQRLVAGQRKAER